MATPDRDSTRRPDPDALLALTAREGRGRLKVFLGAAPGVGKTYAMLQRARQLAAEGTDVVIGLVETHGRSETAALIEGLEVLPRRVLDYRGRRLEEFDLDAALARHPRLLVLDELAHTNPPECRHPKRWQDAEELLAAGIDVWTALNIQHLESLADVVSRITGIAVRETVPDQVLNAADDVVLVDVTPDELIARLNEGKVYVPATARRATQNFFTPANLTALRELALRRTADRVDDQVADYARQTAHGGHWGSAERFLVCISGAPQEDALVRKTSRLATGLNATWLALHLARPGEEDSIPSERMKRIADLLALAERLGGEPTRVTGIDFPNEIIRLARRENVTQIVIGQFKRGVWARLFSRSLSDQLMRQSADIDVHVMSLGEGAAPDHAWFRRALRGIGLRDDILAAAASVGAAIGIGHLLALWLYLPNMSMIFLAAVLFCAVLRGTQAAVVASILSFMGYNFFFIRPLYTFTIAEPHEVFALLVFLFVAVLTGSLAGRLRQQAESVRRRVTNTQSLYEFGRRLSALSGAEDVLWAAAAQLHKSFGRRAVLIQPIDGRLDVKAAWPPDVQLEAGHRSGAEWARSKGEAAGWQTGTLPRLDMQFRPLISPRGVVGICGFEPPDATRPLSAEEEAILSAVLDQTAIAFDRALLFDQAVRAAALEENEAIRGALLASLSHDLRTPLASITGAVTSLRELGDSMSPQQRDELLASIEQESARLSRFVANLLDMSRIESGALKVRRDWVDVSDVVRTAADRARKAFPGRPLSISMEPELPFIRGDASLLEQVLFNLLDNAAKYGGESGTVIHARRDGRQVLVSVTDDGPGIKPTDLDRVFEKFYRGGRNDGRRAGTGLGLSICRGLVTAMGGTIEGQSPAVRRRGTRILIRLPIAAPVEKGAVA